MKHYIDNQGDMSYYVTYEVNPLVTKTEEEFYKELSAGSNFRDFDLEQLENTKFSTRRKNLN